MAAKTNATNITKTNVTESGKLVKEDVKPVKQKEAIVEEKAKVAAKTSESKTTRKVATDKKESTKKKPGAKAVEKITEVTKATRKRAKKGLKTDIVLQYAELELSQDDMLKKVKESFKAAGNKIADMTNVRIYLKPEERKIYFVINNSYEGEADI